MLDLARIDFEKGAGLVTVIAQDARTDAVLMVAHADREAIDLTIATGEMHYRSRTRGLWHKGATSGNTQRVVSLHLDCDGDAVLARVVPDGPACHLGTTACFDVATLAPDALDRLAKVIDERATSPAPAHPPASPESSYTQRLLADRNLRLKKLGEEMAELITACADDDMPHAVEEAADVIYHTLVALRAGGATLNDVRRELSTRERG